MVAPELDVVDPRRAVVVSDSQRGKSRLERATTKTRRRFALRTVKDGAVVIDGTTFKPSEAHKDYDGRLDGLRMAFGRYWTPYGQPEPFVCLGTEAAYKGINHPGWPDCHSECKAEPHCIDGYYVWQWWGTATPEERTR